MDNQGLTSEDLRRERKALLKAVKPSNPVNSSCIAVASNNAHIVAFSTNGNNLCLINWAGDATQESKLELPAIEGEEKLRICKFSPDGRHLAAARGKNVYIWIKSFYV